MPLILFSQCFTVLKYVDPDAPPTRQRGSAMPCQGWAGTIWNSCMEQLWSPYKGCPKTQTTFTLPSIRSAERGVPSKTTYHQSAEANLSHPWEGKRASSTLFPDVLDALRWCVAPGCSSSTQGAASSDHGLHHWQQKVSGKSQDKTQCELLTQ